MGSRLHGNDGERRRTYVVIPAQAGIHGGWKLRWVPVSTGTTVSGGAPMSSFPRRRESTAGKRRWVPVSTGTTVSGGAPMSSFPRRRESTAGEAAMGSRLHGNDGGRRRTYVVIPATAGIHGGGSGDGFPSPRERRWAAAHLCRRSRDGGNPRRVEAAMGSRLHGNDGGRRRTYVVIPATAGIHGGWRRRWVPVSTETTVSGGAPMSSFPRRRESTAGGGGDGFPSPRERRWAAAHLCRHSRDGGNPRRVEAAQPHHSGPLGPAS